MARADKLKAKGVWEKERQDAEMKQLWQTLKFASTSEVTEDQVENRDGNLGGMLSKQMTPKKG